MGCDELRFSARTVGGIWVMCSMMGQKIRPDADTVSILLHFSLIRMSSAVV
jgi:hypothetical protein